MCADHNLSLVVKQGNERVERVVGTGTTEVGRRTVLDTEQEEKNENSERGGEGDEDEAGDEDPGQQEGEQ
jgi:hypothetical protein